MQKITLNGSEIKATLPRRLAAMFYDSIIVCAILFAATALLLPFTHGEAISPQSTLFSLYIICVTFSYFAWSWSHGGYTIGMRAWRLHIKTMSGEPMNIRFALMRFTFAIPSILIAGGGIFWSLLDRDGFALHDRWSKTYLATEPAVTSTMQSTQTQTSVTPPPLSAETDKPHSSVRKIDSSHET